MVNLEGLTNRLVAVRDKAKTKITENWKHYKRERTIRQLAREMEHPNVEGGSSFSTSQAVGLVGLGIAAIVEAGCATMSGGGCAPNIAIDYGSRTSIKVDCLEFQTYLIVELILEESQNK